MPPAVMGEGAQGPPRICSPSAKPFRCQNRWGPLEVARGPAHVKGPSVCPPAPPFSDEEVGFGSIRSIVFRTSRAGSLVPGLPFACQCQPAWIHCFFFPVTSGKLWFVPAAPGKEATVLLPVGDSEMLCPQEEWSQRRLPGLSSPGKPVGPACAQ